jgi:hypothetical protein
MNMSEEKKKKKKKKKTNPFCSSFGAHLHTYYFYGHFSSSQQPPRRRHARSKIYYDLSCRFQRFRGHILTGRREKDDFFL